MTAQPYILLIDSFPARRERIRETLLRTRHRVVVKAEAAEAISIVLNQFPSLIVADIDFAEPKLLRRLREQHQIPLVILLAEGAEEHEIAGFRLGADDVITRPGDGNLLLARITAVLNRTKSRGLFSSVTEEQPIVLGDLVVDPASLSVSVADEPVELSTREFLLLYTLAREAGSVVSRDVLLEQVWGPDFMGETQTIYVYINWLRKKLRAHARESHKIVTVHGVGYKLVADQAEKQALAGSTGSRV